MSWTLESAANDLERYVLRGEPPSVDAAAMMVAWARMGVIGRPTCENTSGYCDVFECSECRCKVEATTEHKSEYGGIFNVPFIPSYCPNCGAEVVE